jgi:glycosyltransferase involved in cell wall biosynthesis
MRILGLLREPGLELRCHADLLAKSLPSFGHELVLLEASQWMPAETGPKVDKTVSERLRREAAAFDVVHAFGYRTAWACAEAFGSKEAWLYTAYDLPKTVHRLFISQLNQSQGGICSSRAVYRALDEALALDLQVIHPGITIDILPLESKPESRARLGKPENCILVGCIDDGTPGASGIEDVIQAMQPARDEHPDAVLSIFERVPGTSSGNATGGVSWEPSSTDFHLWLNALDIFIAPMRRAGFSLATIEAMAAGIPVMVRDAGGLREIVDPDISGFRFRDTEDLASQLKEILGLKLTLETVGHGGRIRAIENFSAEKTAERTSEVYDHAILG